MLQTHSSPPDDILSDVELNKLRWRCRRGLLENDLLIERFFKQYAGQITHARAAALLALMDLPDNDLLDLFLVRTEPTQGLCTEQIHDVLRCLRQPRVL